MTTLRPFGPSVAFTASAMMLMPLSSAARASSSNLSCFGMARVPSFLLENGEDIFLAHDQVLLVIELHLGAGVLPEQDLVPGLHVERDLLALVGDLAVTDGFHLALLGLFLGRVRDDDPALLDLFLFEPLHQKPIVQRMNLHTLLLLRRIAPGPWGLGFTFFITNPASQPASNPTTTHETNIRTSRTLPPSPGGGQPPPHPRDPA